MKKIILTLTTVLIATTIVIAQDVSTYIGKAYDGDGKFLATRSDKADFLFSNPKSVLFDNNGRLYTSQENNIALLYNGAKLDVRAGKIGMPSTTYGHLDGLSKNTYYAHPYGMEKNGNNDIFIADYGNNVIRKLTKFGALGSPQISSTYAGIVNRSGYVDGAVTSAKFDGPLDIIADSKGKMYISDEQNHCIRTISGGKVATACGVGTSYGDKDGAAASAQFDSPSGLFFVDDNHLLICDSRNGKIKEFNASTKQVKTLVSGLVYPTAVAMVGGEMYIADGTVIMKWASKKLSVYAGSKTKSGNKGGNLLDARFGELAGMKYKASEKMLYVVDKKYNIVIKVAAKSGPVGLNNVEKFRANIYPNPASTIIKYSTNNVFINSVSITDLQGKIIKQFSNDKMNKNSINVADINNGVYFISLNHSKGIIRKRIIIQH